MSDQVDQTPPPGVQEGSSTHGILLHLHKHGIIWLIGLGAATLFVMILYFRNQSQQSAASQQMPASDTSQTATPDQMWGSQLDADYQQMQQALTTNTSLLQQLVNQGNTPAPTPTPTPTPVDFKCPPGVLCINNRPIKGGISFGPTGVEHYDATGNANLSQIAAVLGLKSWNDIYAIPANQAIFGKLNYKQARTYSPKAGTVITVPHTIDMTMS